MKNLFLNRGFSLLGVLVASGVGLIVVLGTSQMMVNLSSSVKDLEKQAKKPLFEAMLLHQLGKSCTNTLKGFSDKIGTQSTATSSALKDGSDNLKIAEIKDEQSDVVLDLNAEKQRLAAIYDIDATDQTGDLIPPWFILTLPRRHRLPMC